MAKYESLIPQAKIEVDKFIFNVIDKVIKNTERIVKKTFLDFPKPPIKTGTLRRSITGKVISQDKNSIVGEIRASTTSVLFKSSDGKGKKRGGKIVEYAKYIEYGTYKMQPRPFMRNGVQKAQDTNDKIILSLIKNTNK